MVISLDLYVVKFILSIYLFFYLLQCQWPRHGSEVLENTLLILRGRAIPPSSVGFASGHRGGYCPTPQDLEGIFQYLLAMPRPLSHCHTPIEDANCSITHFKKAIQCDHFIWSKSLYTEIYEKIIFEY